MNQDQDVQYTHRGFRVPDPFAPRQKASTSFINAVLATAFFRCWHILTMFGAWSTLIVVLNEFGYHARFQATLLTVLGTVLGFVISYRTTSSFERYNEGRRLWSQIILASRTFARTLWFHVPDPVPEGDEAVKEEAIKRALIERKTVINLLEAFAVSVKHYLRGEDGTLYKDLYYLVKFLPGYALPAGIPSFGSDYAASENASQSHGRPSTAVAATGVGKQLRSASNTPPPESDAEVHHRTNTGYSTTKTLLPLPATSPTSATGLSGHQGHGGNFRRPSLQGGANLVLPRAEESILQPGYLPPKFHMFDVFPLSLLVNCLTRRGKNVKGKKAARAKMAMVSQDIPLEITLYLSSYIAALQQRKAADVPTINTLLASLNQLVDALTGLERVLTTPIPFSYSFHLWAVTAVYCWTLPFQLWASLGWLTIPGTVVAAFIYFGFLVAGEEIENPFGYDKNDLNLDHFTNNIIRNELRAITSAPPPDPARWVFSPENDAVFATDYERDERIPPEDWVNRDLKSMLAALHAEADSYI